MLLLNLIIKLLKFKNKRKLSPIQQQKNTQKIGDNEKKHTNMRTN